MANVEISGLPRPYLPCAPASLRAYVYDLQQFLQSPLVSFIISAHPNHISLQDEQHVSNYPSDWAEWMQFFDRLGDSESFSSLSPLSATSRIPSHTLRNLVSTAQLPPNSPESFRLFISHVWELCLNRSSPIAREDRTPSPGMSMKKSHEVNRLAATIRSMTKGPASYVVDVGAGQGYLSRELAFPSNRPVDVGETIIHVLALDSDSHQVEGAQKREGAIEGKSRRGNVRPAAHNGSITHKHTFVSASNLSGEIDLWLRSHHASDTTRSVVNGDDPSGSSDPVPVIFTGLHACGSLTPAVLHCFSQLAEKHTHHLTDDTQLSSRQWATHGLAIVGCCYNLMNENDFPMSDFGKAVSPLKLTSQHLQLACQAPYQWITSNDTWNKSVLARKKVVYRALLGRFLKYSGLSPAPSLKHSFAQVEDGGEEGASGVMNGKRLGRINSSAYADWSTFLRHAFARLDLSEDSLVESKSFQYIPDHLPSRLACLHVVRCLLGPVIESLIIADRALFLTEHLGKDWTVRIVNVFQQEAGSARNVAIVVNKMEGSVPLVAGDVNHSFRSNPDSVTLTSTFTPMVPWPLYGLCLAIRVGGYCSCSDEELQDLWVRAGKIDFKAISVAPSRPVKYAID